MQPSHRHHDHAGHTHHGHAAESDARDKSGPSHDTHTMPDGTVMKGAQHDHGATHLHHHRPVAGKPTLTTPPGQVEYTCPMHPQIRQIGPGHCPICGMALEPVVATE